MKQLHYSNTENDRAHIKKIFQVMPREMYFGPSRATSIDLCVRDLMLACRKQQDIRIFSEPVKDPFESFSITPLPVPHKHMTYHKANFIAAQARMHRPDLIIVQQHLPTAAAIALRVPDMKVVLHTHNFQKSYATTYGPGRWLKRYARKFRYERLAGIIHVSKSCEATFIRDWPEITTPGCVVSNGVDFSCWRPALQRSQEIVYAGRCVPEKGVLETARAVAQLLPNYSGWKVRFILSAVDAHPGFLDSVRSALANLGAQAEIQIQMPFEAVKSAFEHAAIAVTPSICNESFGRTALEAHAGGAALISSGAGGLAEISGCTALRLGAVESDEIACAIDTLIKDESSRNHLASEGAIRVRQRFNIHQQAETFIGFCENVSNGSLTRTKHFGRNVLVDQT